MVCLQSRKTPPSWERKRANALGDDAIRRKVCDAAGSVNFAGPAILGLHRGCSCGVRRSKDLESEGLGVRSFKKILPGNKLKFCCRSTKEEYFI
jgi:hypothetical protein